jgi:hypothetical protein
VSTLWTPGGEQPVGREPSPDPSGRPDGPGGAAGLSDEEQQAVQMLEAILATPVSAVVVNHAVALLELAQLHLGVVPPNLAEAQLAIDAGAALIEGLSGRLGPDEVELKAGLAQLRMAFVQIRAVNLGTAEPPPDPASSN